jgi:hypothetical protein
VGGVVVRPGPDRPPPSRATRAINKCLSINDFRRPDDIIAAKELAGSDKHHEALPKLPELLDTS